MSIFQCQNCGCAENTACSFQGFKAIHESFDWSYAPELAGLKVCRACGPTLMKSGKPIEDDLWGEYGQWHNQFDRVFLPLGMFKTGKAGCLEHIETGENSYRDYALNKSENPNVS